MPFNKNISGYKNEEEFAHYLNNKKVGRVGIVFQELLFAIFDNIGYYDTIYSWVNYSKKKADITIKINSQVRGISIKKGVKNSTHVEPLSLFCAFLKENGIKEEMINEICRYHYGDGTIDGTGTNRVSISEYKIGKEETLREINQSLNHDILLEKAINRFVLQGNNSNHEVAALIYGVLEDFIWITNEEIKYIIKKNKNVKTDSLHFGSLYLQSAARNLNYNPNHEYKRNYIQIKWYHLSDDIIEVMATYRNGRTHSSLLRDESSI